MLGQSMSLVRNPEYNGRFRGNLQQVELTCKAEKSIVLQKYEDGELDVISGKPVCIRIVDIPEDKD